MAALAYFVALTQAVRNYLHQNPDVLPAMVLAHINAQGGLASFAVALGVADDMDEFLYLATLYLECHRLCDLGRGWVPYQPMVPPP
jgi:hypothetical protein